MHALRPQLDHLLVLHISTRGLPCTLMNPSLPVKLTDFPFEAIASPVPEERASLSLICQSMEHRKAGVGLALEQVCPILACIRTPGHTAARQCRLPSIW